METILRDRADALTRAGAKTVLQQLRQELVKSQRSGEMDNTAWVLVHTAMVLRGQRKLSAVPNLLNEAQNLFSLTNNEFGQASVFYELSLAHRELGRDTLAFDLGLKAASLFQSLGRMLELAWAYNNLAIISFNQSHRAESLSYAKKAHGIFVEFNSENGVAWNNCTLGMIYHQMGFFDVAEKLYTEATHSFERLNNRQGQAWSLLGQGMILRSLCRLSEAESTLNKARDLFADLELHDRLGWCLLNLAAIKRLIGHTEEAILLNKEAIQLFTPLRNHDGVAWGLFQMGQIYRDQGLLVKAWQTFREGSALHSDVCNRVGMAWHDNELGEAYLEMGDLPRARENLIRAYTAATQLDLISLKADVDRNMASLYLEEGAMQKASELLDRSENHAQKCEAKDILAATKLARVRLWLMMGDATRAKEAADTAGILIESTGLKYLKPLLGTLLAESLVAFDRPKEALVVFQDTAFLAKKLMQRHVRAEALLGALQLQRHDKGPGAIAFAVDHVEKDVRAVGSRKLKAKFLAIKGVLSETSKVPAENKFFRQSLNTLVSSGLRSTEKQLIDLILTRYQENYSTRVREDYRKSYDELMSQGPADLHLIRPRVAVQELLPVSLAV
ncbi:MAG: hypothetical protein KCHDKBKB_00927 [Elusimicrobia bacterium]|nr:hypothetical protein [Elusimicrobiota bacterium]